MNCSVCSRPLGKEEEEKGLCTHCSNNEDKTRKKEAVNFGLGFVTGATIVSTIVFVAGKSTKNKS